MQILMLTSTLPRFDGDMQANFVGEQVAAWLAARPDHELTILAPHSDGAARSERLGRARVERFQYFAPASAQGLAYPAILPNLKRNRLLWAQVPPFLFAEYRAARKLAKQIGAQCTYAHWIMPQGFVAWRLKRELGIPYFLQNHSSDLAVFHKLGEPGRKLARTILREAEHFFCVNASQREDMLSLFSGAERDAMAARATVLPMGIAELPEAGSGDAQRFDIATIGRLSAKKGLDLLIRAAEGLAARGVRPRIGIAGEGEEKAKLAAMVDKADVTFAGFVTGEAKDRFLASADRFVFPALAADGDVEGMPVALLEGMARGVPTLASRDTNIEMLPEWPQIRDQIIFVENPADIAALEAGLERLMTAQPSAELAQIIGRYRWERLIEEYLTPIEAAIA